MNARYYILDGDELVPAPDVREWGAWFEQNHLLRRVDATEIGDARVSTVFLGLDHSFGDGPPEVFETMVFGGVLDQECVRYATKAEAIAGHAAMCARVKGALQ